MFKTLKKPKYLIIVVLIAIIMLIIGGLEITHDIEEYIEETQGIKIDMNSNGSSTIYVKDGVIVSLQGVYHNDNFIAIKVKGTNNNVDPVTITAKIGELEEEIEFTVLDEAYQYIVIGDSMASSYEFDVLIEQRGLPLASGVVHITQDTNNAVVLETEDMLLHTQELEVYYLGNNETTHFFRIRNNYSEPKNIKFIGELSGFDVNVENGHNTYVAIDGLGNTTITLTSFEISAGEVKEEKIEGIEEIPYAN